MMRRVGDTILKASNRSFVASASAKQVRSNSNIYPIISTASIKPDALQYTSNFRHSSSSTSPPASYLCVHVFVSVKPGTEKEFLNASLANARASSLEPGIARFDVIQQEDDPTKFVLVEVYKTNDAPAAHKETQHYLTWRTTVEDMMAEPRKALKYRNLFPATAEGWDYGDDIPLE